MKRKATKHIKLFLLTLVISAVNSTNYIHGQVSNDECIYAHHINDVESFCSDPLDFSTEGATASSQVRPSCWPQGTTTNDVWYSFNPKNIGAVFTLIGQTVAGEGTLVEPSIALYTGDCNSLTELACGSVLFDENIIEITQTDLIIGKTYYIRVDARNNNIGSFKLCISTFTPVKAPESDCVDAVILCNKDPFFVEKIQGVGSNANEVDNTCIRQELASVWYKWTCKDAGTLSFTLTPNNPVDDLDFVVYELSNGLDGCGTKRPIRCMASGESIGSSQDLNSPCFGATGLNFTESDVEEQPGCFDGSNNFIKYIDMEAGVSYALVINNFSESGAGFGIEWGGTGTFLGPEADFEIEAQQAFECDKTIFFYNKSSSTTDPIVNYTWNFGDKATPETASNMDSLPVIYGSFGEKTAAIIVESSKGCIVSKIIDFYIDPCCQDTSTLNVSGDATEIICPQDSNAIITAAGRNGNPSYKYSLDDNIYQPNPRFSELSAGEYTLYIVDSKGCKDSTIVQVDLPPPVEVTAEMSQEIELGEMVTLKGTAFSIRGIDTTYWYGNGFLSEADRGNLEPTILPYTTETYILEGTDEFGCKDTAHVTIRVKIVRPVESPNVFSPGNNDGINDFFNLFGGPAIQNIQELRVYDRWGNKMFKGNGIEANSFSEGWDGKFNGKLVNPGVYVWSADVLFIDGVVISYAGDVTVMR